MVGFLLCLCPRRCHQLCGHCELPRLSGRLLFLITADYLSLLLLPLLLLSLLLSVRVRLIARVLLLSESSLLVLELEELLHLGGILLIRFRVQLGVVA